ncbi:MAG: iron-containing redox enzyme family protein [Acidobacteria bacterium]|nr:iron-containing redox enzyme family protein [Acidobacteriota bacterium]
MIHQQRIDQSIARWNLLDSAFYQAWSAGTLPVDSLRLYAREYGAFILRVADGWDAHGDQKTAEVEREHVELWRNFAQALGTDIGEAETPAVKALVETSDKLFADRAASLGALYAFEAQQPHTATSKLEGLRAHYDLPKTAEVYFDVHKDDWDEPAVLRERMAALTAEEQETAAQACEQMSQALREALDALPVAVGC